MKFREGKKILVMDDDSPTRGLVKVTLEKAGFAVTTCRNGKEGVSRFNQEKFDLVITDISMPVINGLDAIVLMRKENPTVPIIAMSGVERSLSFLKMADYFTADATLQKPFDPKILTTTVKKVLKAG
ncbi:MAG: response regulator [Chitinispirillaceae bacterium]|nr:response regulator [Chitinispirillaceae bacterium]